jgi:YfiH family protein
MEGSGVGSGVGSGAYLTMPALAGAGIRVAFTTRHGGVSGDPYSSLNLSFVSGDDPAAVLSNRARSLAAIGARPEAWTSGRQVHGAGVAGVGRAEAGAGSHSPETTLAATDAVWTEEPGIVLAVLTADCVPVLLADAARGRIAAVHAGWRGLVAGVIEAAAEAMGAGASTTACLGPSIGPCCYEVGEDVAGAAAASLGNDVVRGGDGARLTLDLWRSARIALRRAGIGDVRPSALCTRCEPHRFYSHRAGDVARQGLLAMIEPGGKRAGGGG